MVSILYQHQLQGRNIRTLQLLPGKPGDPIHCHLVEVSLDSSETRYEAISYVWGDHNDRQSILCNDVEIPITTGLAEALNAVRLVNQPRWLWADAICVNQGDLEERSQQVQMMGDIFKKADKVLVWLGADDSGLMALYKNVTSQIASRGQQITYAETLQDDVVHEILQKLDDKTWIAINTLYEKPWWSRVWCFQEFVLARAVSFIYGSDLLSGDSILWLTRFVFRYMVQYMPKQANFAAISRASLRINCKEDCRSLRTLAGICASLQASYPRDKIYGVLGIAEKHSSGTTAIVVDYNKSVQQVYIDAVLHSLATESAYQCLFLAPGTIQDGESAFPSWCLTYDLRHHHYDILLMACASPMSAVRQERAFNTSSAHLGILQIHGIVLDVIGACRSEHNDTENNNQQADRIGRCVQDIIQLFDGFIKNAPTIRDFEQVLKFKLQAVDDQLSSFHPNDELYVESLLYEQLQAALTCKCITCFLEFLQKMENYFDDSLEHSRSYAFQAGLVRSCRIAPFRTQRGYVGLAGPKAHVGDVVAIFHGSPVQYILRPLNPREYAFVATCFVPDINDGQIYDMLGTEGVEEKEFILR